MGTTLWVLGRDSAEAGDDWDHSAMYIAADDLDAICDQLAVTKLSEFFDWADFNANLGDEGAEELEPAWHDGSKALPTLIALRDRLAADASDLASLSGQDHLQSMLVEEIDDCILKVSALAARSEPFHLCVVM